MRPQRTSRVATQATPTNGSTMNNTGICASARDGVGWHLARESEVDQSNRSKRNRLLASALAVLLVAASASPALATSCQRWRRLTEDQRWDRIYRMIDDAITSQRSRQYQVNRAAIGRCLETKVEPMYWEFEDTCSNPSTARSQAINRIFKNYIWSCL
jgi:hypothetical protein